MTATEKFAQVVLIDVLQFWLGELEKNPYDREALSELERITEGIEQWKTLQ